MHPQSKITEWCERALEYGWLLCIGIIPSYFNLLSARHFEPDKAVLFRAFVTVLCAIAVIHWIEQRRHTNATPAVFSIQRSFLAYSIVAYCSIFLFATVTSIVPGISFWGRINASKARTPTSSMSPSHSSSLSIHAPSHSSGAS